MRDRQAGREGVGRGGALHILWGVMSSGQLARDGAAHAVHRALQEGLGLPGVGDGDLGDDARGGTVLDDLNRRQLPVGDGSVPTLTDVGTGLQLVDELRRQALAGQAEQTQDDGAVAPVVAELVARDDLDGHTGTSNLLVPQGRLTEVYKIPESTHFYKGVDCVLALGYSEC